jgi:hypothetical protein
MNCFHLLYWLFVVLCGIVGFITGFFFGTGYAIGGTLFGLFTGYGILCGTVYLKRLSYKWFSIPPLCQHGQCAGGAYELVNVNQRCSIYRCHCGDQYCLTGDRFMAIHADGSMRPFRRRTLLGRWVRDEDK